MIMMRWNPDCCSALGNLNMWKKQRISFRQYKKPIMQGWCDSVGSVEEILLARKSLLPYSRKQRVCQRRARTWHQESVKIYWQESHCFKSSFRFNNEKVAQSQSDGFDSTPIKPTTIQEVPALLSVKSKPKSKPVKDSVQPRSHSNPKERSTSLGNQGMKRLSLPSNGKTGKGVGSSNSKVSQPTKAN